MTRKLDDLIAKKKELNKHLEGVQKKIAGFEHFFLAETNHCVNLLKPFEKFTNPKPKHLYNIVNIKKARLNNDYKLFTQYSSCPKFMDTFDDSFLELYREYITMSVFEELDN